MEFRDGRPARMIGIVRDVTERRLSEDELRRSEARLSGILAIAADAIISIGDDHRITMFNHGAEQIFGYAAAEVVGQSIDILMPSRFHTAHGPHIRYFAESGATARRMGERREIFGLRKDGSEFPAEASISMLDVGGQRIFTVVLRDITARREVERRLAEVNEQLEERVAQRTSELAAETERRLEAQAALARAQRMEAFGQLAGGIAHDFNNLLTVISGNQELLEMRLKDPKDLALLKRSQEAAEMGARLTSRLLTFARRRRLEPTLINLNEQITGMVELLRRSIGEDIALTTNLAPQLWSARADASEIENAVLNLAINARDAMPSGGSLIIETADCSIEQGEIGGERPLAPGDYVRVSVSDTGTGMTPDVMERAFEPFFTTKPPGKGTGLGLSTIYGFVQQSGGTVTVRSQPGDGTTVSIYLPRAATASGPLRADRPGDGMPHARGETVLVVEDNPSVRAVTVQHLEDLGYAVREVDTGVAAIEIIREPGHGIDVVLSDVVMPGGMSGFDVASWLGENAPELKVLLMSGYPDQAAMPAAAAQPALRILKKPYSRLELARAVREALDASKS
jgi:PAS domain S-box-containing protein